MFANTIPTLVKQVNYQTRHAQNGFHLKRKKKVYRKFEQLPSQQ